MTELEAAIEAILFSTGRAVSLADLAMAAGHSEKETLEAVQSLAGRMDSEKRGVQIICLEDSFQMCTRKEYYPQLIALELHPRKPKLTDVLLETLSVIAYRQPVTKSEIERIRGVNSDHAVNRLVEYELVCEVGRARQPGRPILFGTTEAFLRSFGVSSRDSLPEISPVQLEDFREEAIKEAESRGTEEKDAGDEEVTV